MPLRACVLLLLTSAAASAAPYNVDWFRTYFPPTATRGLDFAARDDGNVYLTGHRAQPSGFGTDGYATLVDRNGSVLWDFPIDGGNDDFANGVAVDPADRAWIVGSTGGPIGGSNAGDRDVFVLALNAGGTIVHQLQFGSSDYDTASTIATDSAGNIYLSGVTGGSLFGAAGGNGDAFLMKLNSAGNVLWNKQLGGIDADEIRDIAVDHDGNIYCAQTLRHEGTTIGESYTHSYLNKFDANGSVIWSTLVGAGTTDISRVAINPVGDVLVAGTTDENLGLDRLGQGGAFLRRYSASGESMWTTLYGTRYYGAGDGVDVDIYGNAFFVWDNGGGGGQLAKLGPQGEQIWSRTIPADGLLFPRGVEEIGDAIIVGGSFSSSVRGASSPTAFLMRLSKVPEPSGISWLWGFAVLAYSMRAARRRPGPVWPTNR